MTAASLKAPKDRQHSIIRYLLCAVFVVLLVVGAAKAISLTRCTHDCRPGATSTAPSPDEPASV